MNPEHPTPGGGPDTAAAAHAASSKPISNCEDAQRVLQQLRVELDGLDQALLDTVRRRLDCCCRIGLHKRDHAIPMMQPQRIGVVQARAAAFAVEHGVSAPFLRSLYELIIAETCRLEDEIIGVPSTSA